jgi:uncharacterized protein YecE (DUF72 family)
MNDSGLRIGTSGWNYPSGQGTWNGIFYPKGRSRKTFDELAYYADHFDTVEVNSSFYGVPAPETTRGWVARTPKGFEFSLKLYQKFTHPKMFREAQLKRAKLPAGETGGSMLDLLAQVTQADIDDVKRSLDPIASAGKLGALLAQFPPSFKDTPDARAYLDTLLRTFAGYRVAVELRHKSWSDEIASTLHLLNSLDAAWVQIDEPKFQLSIRQNYLPNVTSFYYLRLHGRNAKNWWRHDKAEDRYDYLYAKDELDSFIDIAKAVRALVKKMYLYTNNHFAAKSVANALMLKDGADLPITGQYPPEFLEHYPDLRDIVPPAGTAAPAETEADTAIETEPRGQGKAHARRGGKKSNAGTEPQPASLLESLTPAHVAKPRPRARIKR